MAFVVFALFFCRWNGSDREAMGLFKDPRRRRRDGHRAWIVSRPFCYFVLCQFVPVLIAHSTTLYMHAFVTTSYMYALKYCVQMQNCVAAMGTAVGSVVHTHVHGRTVKSVLCNTLVFTGRTTRRTK